MTPDHDCVPSAPKPVRAPIPQPASNPQVAQHPQPIDYGLSESDILLHQRYRPSAPHLKYRHERDFSAFWRLLGFGSIIDRKQERRSRAAYLKFEEARLAYEAIEAAKRKAARDAELRKRSYWEFLDGYAFERATAEVLNKHQFNPRVTPGSGDGGVDIEVTRNGLQGVVQCKAHVACVGPHVVRDLYGVIHHCGADFGIIVSRGGFTRGAHDFKRDKPIFFLDTDDLIAMQEGQDVLAGAFRSHEH
jgi:Restriction endonuclease